MNSAPADALEAQEEPRTGTEASFLDAAERVLPPQAIPFDADFFTDLGGHSLLVARFVSAVRETRALARITLQDVYTARSLRVFGRLLDRQWAQGAAPEDLSFTPPPLLRRFLCGCAQALALSCHPRARDRAMARRVRQLHAAHRCARRAFSRKWLRSSASICCINIATVAIVVAAKWLVIGRTKPGRYPLWGVYYFRWWLVKRFLGLTHIEMVPGLADHAPLSEGARAPRSARTPSSARSRSGAADLISIGAGASIGASQIRQRASRRQRTSSSVDRHRRRRLYRHVLRHRGKCRHRRGRRTQGF